MLKKKRNENNFEQFLYFFSKLAFSLILLICLIVALYILYINYKNESIISQTQNISEIQLEKSINNNSNLINKLIDGIKTNETALISINEKINLISSQESDNKISVINDDIQILKKVYKVYQKKFRILKVKI